MDNIPSRSNVLYDASLENDKSSTTLVQLTVEELNEIFKVGEILDVSVIQTGGGCGVPQITI